MNKFLICSPYLTERLTEIFFNKSEESASDLLSKFQMTNFMNKQFLFFFNSNPKEFYSQLIIIKNLHILIDLILMKKIHNETIKQNGLSISVVNVYYNLNDDSLGDIVFKCKKGKKIDLEFTLEY